MFQLGDLVLRFQNTADLVAGKFQPNWEGPYLVTRVGESGSYALDKLNGTLVPRMWNALHLKRHYQLSMIRYLHIFLSIFLIVQGQLKSPDGAVNDLSGLVEITSNLST